MPENPFHQLILHILSDPKFHRHILTACIKLLAANACSSDPNFSVWITKTKEM